MPEKPNGKLTYKDRCFIEDGIRVRMTFSEMSRHLGVAKSTVSKEVKRNSTDADGSKISRNAKGRNVCTEAGKCKARGICGNGCMALCSECSLGLCNGLCPDFKAAMCPRLEKAPFVCNECLGRFDGTACSFARRFYNAKTADEIAKERLVTSRQGIDCTPEQLKEAADIVRPLLKKGQSLDHIWETHGDELPCSKRSFYRYIGMGALEGIVNLDLPKKVKFKARKRHEPHVPRHEMAGRTYLDFQALPLEVQMSAVQMDCVEGKRGEKPTILTLLFRRFNFQIMMLIPEQNQEEVVHALDLIEGLLDGDFSKYFGIILTDRGSEFLDPLLIETGTDGKQRCKVYYCDPMKSGQKGSCEKNHVEIRKILPKGTSFVGLTGADIALVSSHVNSYTRPILGGVAPYALASQVLPAALLEGLGMEFVPPDEVTLKPALLAQRK